MNKKHRIWMSTILLVFSFIAAIALSWTATSRQLTSLEAVLLQTFVMAFGLLGSFIFGQATAEQAGKELIRHHARPAFRRLLSLYSSLSRMAAVLACERDTRTTEDSRESSILRTIEALVTEQISTADDALSDWSDVCPDDVSEILKKSAKNERNN